jgi:hypothetical protein
MIANPENLNAVRRDLAGHDLACWCPLDQPCHADVLLELANADPAYLHEIRTAPAFSSPSTGGTSTVPEVASLRTGSGVAGPTNVKLSAHT